MNVLAGRWMYIILLLACLGCQGNKENFDIKKIAVDLSRDDGLSVFDIFCGIEVVPLETTDSILLSYIYPLVYEDVYFMKQNNPQQITCFDSSGHFKFRINNCGRGPLEYNAISEISVNPYVPEFYLLESLDCMDVYDMEGHFLEKITFPFQNGVQTGIFPLNRDTLIIASGRTDQTLSFFSLKDKRLVARYNNPMPPTSRPFYSCNGELYHYTWYDPVVYRVQDTSFVPAFAFDFGKYANPEEYYKDEEKVKTLLQAGEEAFGDKFRVIVRCIYCNSKYLYLQVVDNTLKKPQSVFVWYDKEKHKSSVIREFKEKIPLSFFDVMTDKFLMSLQLASQKEKLDVNLLDERNRKIYEKIQSEDNPFLILYRFK